MAKKCGNKLTEPSRQTYVSINDINASVPHITTLCKEAFKLKSLLIVSGNGLAIEDNETTRGKNEQYL